MSTGDDCRFIDELASVIRPYVLHIYRELKLGLCKTNIEVERIPGASEEIETQFRLVLPYCSKKLKWEVIFDPTTPWFAPDFRFDDDSFMYNLDEDYLEKELPSLAKWKENDVNALSDVILEMIRLYKNYQIKKLNEDESRASFEYSALVGDAVTSENDIEVWVGSHVVEFLIKLNVDTSRLPEVYNESTEVNPGVDTALLFVRYPNPNNAELVLSPTLMKLLGDIKLPPMHQGDVLMDYVPMVAEILNKKVQTILNNEKIKRELLSLMVVKFEGAVLEHDSNSAAFLFETNDYHWVLLIEIDTKFPETPPILTLRSVYHSTNGKPKFKVLPSCPPENIEEFVEEQVEIFKNECKGIAPSNL